MSLATYTGMDFVVLGFHLLASLFAVVFIVLYLRIIVHAKQIGPAPTSWILAAVGLALIVASKLLETVFSTHTGEIFFQMDRVYFMLGNVLMFIVLYRVYRGLGDAHE